VREVSLEVGGSAVKPPSGVEGDAAQFLVAGFRVLGYDVNGSGLMAAIQLGQSLEEGAGSDYVSGTVEGALWKELAPGWFGGFEARGFGFDVVAPFSYRALGVEGGPGIRFSSSKVSASVKGVFGTGWSRTQLLPFPNRPGAILEEDLWRAGATADLLTGSGTAMVGLAAGVHDSPGGTYRSLGGRVLLKGAGALVQLQVDRWETPLGGETTGGLALVLPLGDWSLKGFLGRTEPDPLTLTEPSAGAGGVLLGWKIGGKDPLPLPGTPLHQLLDSGGDRSRVRLRVRPPQGTERVQLLGDFTYWEPIPMDRSGEDWVLELEVPEGVHHFGFLVDGSWYVPEDAPDTLADEWGRLNATLVIER
jgi:hypothetical protein